MSDLLNILSLESLGGIVVANLFGLIGLAVGWISAKYGNIAHRKASITSFSRNLGMVGARRWALAAASIAGGLILPLGGSAQARFFGSWGTTPTFSVPQYTMMAPTEIYRIIVECGYQISGRLQHNGRDYHIDVIDQWGRPLRLIIDPYEGYILQVFSIKPSRPVAPILYRLQSRTNHHASYRVSAPRPAAVAGKFRVIIGIAPLTGNAARRNPLTKTKIATREIGATTAKPSRFGHAAHAEAVAPWTRHSTRTEAKAPLPSVKVEPATGAPKPAPIPTPESATAAAIRPQPPASSLQPTQQKTDGPGSANGVPINPLD